MATSSINLVEHIDNKAVYSIAFGSDELPVLYSVGKGLETCTAISDVVGSSAIICTLEPPCWSSQC